MYYVQSSALEATVLFNYTAVHALPVATNILTNTFLRTANSLGKINAYIWPWPEPELLDKKKFIASTKMMVMIGFVLVLVVPTFASEIVRDQKVIIIIVVIIIITRTMGRFIFR